MSITSSSLYLDYSIITVVLLLSIALTNALGLDFFDLIIVKVSSQTYALPFFKIIF